VWEEGGTMGAKENTGGGGGIHGDERK